MKQYTLTELINRCPFRISRVTLTGYAMKYAKRVYRQHGGGKRIFVIQSLDSLWKQIKEAQTGGLSKSRTKAGGVVQDYLFFAKKVGVIFNVEKMVWDGRNVKWNEKGRLIYSMGSKKDVIKDWYDNYGVSSVREGHCIQPGVCL